jgi:hypothetical protein
VRHTLTVVFGVCLIGIGTMTWTSAQQAKPARAPAAPATAAEQVPPAASIDQALKAIRADLQNSRADVIAKNMPLTAAEAAKFWPVYERYQKEQDAIMDDQLKSVQWFVDNFDKADDAAALRLINAHFDRDTKMVALRQKWLPEFQKVVGTKMAVRAMQIDRSLSMAHQAFIASRIPLTY